MDAQKFYEERLCGHYGGPFAPFPSPNWDDHQYYSTIQTADINGDGKAELLGRKSNGMVSVSYVTSGWWQLGDPGPFSDGHGWAQEKFYSTIQTADIYGDGKAELLGRSADGMVAYSFENKTWKQLVSVDGLPPPSLIMTVGLKKSSTVLSRRPTSMGMVRPNCSAAARRAWKPITSTTTAKRGCF